LILLSHCLLNQLVRAGGSFTPGVTEKLLALLSKFSVFIYQLPCPEYFFLGLRDKKTQDLWEKVPGFKDFISHLADDLKEKIQQITENENLVLIAIARSPCCSTNMVYRADNLVKGKGMWVAELEKRFNFDIIEFDFKKVDESLLKLKEFLNKKVK